MVIRERKDKMRKIQQFMKNRCGIDELNLLFLCLSLVSYFIYIFLPEEKAVWACIVCLIFILLCSYRMFSQNLEWRKKENRLFVKFCSFFMPSSEETEEEREERKRKKIEKKNKKVKQKTTKKVEEGKEQIEEEIKESEEKVVIAKEKQEEKSEIEKKEDELRQREKERKEREEQRKKEEEKRAAEALAREQKKREQRKREQRFDPNYVYFNCPYCNQAIRIPKRQGKVKITCPTCKNKFIKET